VFLSSEIRAELRMLHVTYYSKINGGYTKAIMFFTLLLTEGDE